MEEAWFLSLGIGEMLKTILSVKGTDIQGLEVQVKLHTDFRLQKILKTFKKFLKMQPPYCFSSFRFLPNLARSALHKNLQDSGIETSPDDMKLEEKDYTCKLLPAFLLLFMNVTQTVEHIKVY